MMAGRFASAAETRNQTSCGSHGVSVIMVPSGKLSCNSCNDLRVGMRRTVFAGFQSGMRADEKERAVTLRLPTVTRAWLPMAWRRAAM